MLNIVKDLNLQAVFYVLINICDTIKGNGSHVGNIQF